MNKRIKKKRRLTALLYLLKARIGLLERSNSLQQEVIEDYGRQLGEAKRELADLQAVVGRNAQATNNRFDKLEKELEQVKTENKKLRQELKAKRSWFGRK